MGRQKALFEKCLKGQGKIMMFKVNYKKKEKKL